MENFDLLSVVSILLIVFGLFGLIMSITKQLDKRKTNIDVHSGDDEYLDEDSFI